MNKNKPILIMISLFLLTIPFVTGQGTVTRSYSDASPQPDDDVAVTITVDLTGQTEDFYAVDDQVPATWIIHSFWDSTNYCDAAVCGPLDSGCAATCQEGACDTTAGQVCTSSVWTTTDYCTNCGDIDYDCASSCTDNVCDIDKNYWCDSGTWSNSNYCDNCYKYDSECCTLMAGAICDRTCASDECDTASDVWCSTDTDGGDTHETNHVKWAVTSGAAGTSTSYIYNVRSPLTVGPYTWTGIYMFEGMSSETSIPPPDTVTNRWCTPGDTQACGSNIGECVAGTRSCGTSCGAPTDYEWCSSCDGAIGPTQEVCDDLDNNCDTFTDEGCDEDGDDYCNSTMTTVGSPATCPSGGGDCDDSDINRNPGETEVCLLNGITNGIDDDCDGEDDFVGDTDCSGCVDIFDLSTVGGNFGSSGPVGDLNEDSIVDIFDLVMVGSNFGDEDIPGACG